MYVRTGAKQPNPRTYKIKHFDASLTVGPDLARQDLFARYPNPNSRTTCVSSLQLKVWNSKIVPIARQISVGPGAELNKFETLESPETGKY